MSMIVIVLAALIVACGIAGLAVGFARGLMQTVRMLVNQVEYLRARLAMVSGEVSYTPPPEPTRKAKQVSFPDFGSRKNEDAA